MEEEIQLAELFYQINRRIWKLLAPMFKEAQLSLTEIIVLATMVKKKKSRVSDLAALTGLPASTLTGILDRLVEQRLLERSQDPEDRRGVVMTATPKLTTSVNEFLSPMRATLRTRLDGIPKPRLKRITEDLRFILERMDGNGAD